MENPQLLHGARFGWAGLLLRVYTSIGIALLQKRLKHAAFATAVADVAGSTSEERNGNVPTVCTTVWGMDAKQCLNLLS